MKRKLISALLLGARWPSRRAGMLTPHGGPMAGVGVAYRVCSVPFPLEILRNLL